MKTIIIAAAIKTELNGVLRLARFAASGPGGANYRRAELGGADVVLVVSGIGGERAYETAARACRELSPAAYVSVGMSAGLVDNLMPGDVVIASGTRTLGGGEVYNSDEALLASISNKPLVVRVGEIAAADRVAATAAEKRAIAAMGNYIALDMESAGAARACYEEGVPFIAVRGISDALGDDLPVDFNRFIKDGALDWPRFGLHVITHPACIPGLVRLGRGSSLAAKNIGITVGGLLISWAAD